MSALVWLIIGIALAALEAIVPGTVIIWFGLGGLFTSLFVKLGILNNTITQCLFFFFSSLGFLLLWILFFRRMFKKGSAANERDPMLDGLQGTVVNPIAPGIPGKIELTTNFHGLRIWSAVSTEDLPAGTVVKVVESNGIHLVVQKK
jgi:membrane protein implicated in regulation of membrane protease activity